MTTPDRPPDDADEGADTQMFRAFVEREDSATPPPQAAPFRLLTLAVGLLVVAGIVWLLLR